jgi:biopolymer transport protein ExbD
VDEEELLKFSNLKKIDRTSVSIMLPNSRKSRQSRVTISGDKSFFYET